MKHIAELSTYGYRRVWALLRKESEYEGAETVNTKRATGSCVIITCFWKEKGLRCQPVLITEKWLCRKATSDAAHMALSSTAITVNKLRVTFALDCCDREALDWIATNGGYTSDIVTDVMMNSISKRFGNQLPDTPIEFLSNNGSCYTAKETRAFSNQLDL